MTAVDVPEWVAGLHPVHDRGTPPLFWSAAAGRFEPGEIVGQTMRLVRTYFPEIEEEARAAGASSGMAFWRHVRAALDDRGQAWCRVHGLSAARTMRGERRPSPEDVAAGHVQAAGPLWARMFEWCRTHDVDVDA